MASFVSRIAVLRTIAVTATTLVWTAAARAADPVTVLEQVRVATGGAAWSAVQRLHMRSRLMAGGRAGTQERFEDVATGRFVRAAHLPGNDVARGFDGVSTWTTGCDGVAYVLGDADARLAAVDDGYRVARGWWRPDDFPATLADAGVAREGARAFDRVRITPEGGRPFVLWIDHQTHLVDRIVEQQAEALAITRFADYRRVGPLLLPFAIRTGDGDASSDDVESVDAIDLDPATTDERFAVPPLPPLVAASAGAIDDKPVVVPFRFENGQVLVDVTLDGRRVTDALFDTGGSLVVPPVVLAELGVRAQGGSKLTGGGEGSITVGSGSVESMALGGALVQHPGFVSFAWDPEHPRRLIIGLELLQRYVVRLDFEARTMTLTRPARFRFDGQGSVLPFHFQDNQPEVTGSVDGVAGTFAVDTGDNGSLLLIAPFAHRYGFATRYHATIPYGGTAVTETHGLMARAGEIALDGADGRPVVRVSHPLTRISTQTAGFDANRYVSGNVGTGILRQFDVTFDYAGRRIILVKNRHFVDADHFSLSGLRTKRRASQLVVDTVYPSGPAERAGVRPGDVLLTIDGVSVPSLDSSALDTRLNETSGAAVKLQLLGAHGETRQVSLVLHDVL